MPGIRTSAITYRRGISNNTPNFFLFAQANYVIPQPTNKFRQNVVVSVAPPPNTTILVYNTSQGSSFTWDTVVFTLEPSLPNYSYRATTTSIPASQVPARINLTGVTIGNTVTSIGQNAFLGCTNLTSVTFTPTSTLTSIGQSAFQSCSGLTSVTIPNSVTSILSTAFASCTNLTSVTLPPNNPSFTIINLQTFDGCSKLTSITIPNTVITIDTNAFNSCSGLKSVIFTQTSKVTTIGSTAFQSCGLLAIEIPNSVININYRAFFNCCLNMTSVIFTPISQVTTIGPQAFAVSPGSIGVLASIIIPDTVTSIDGISFQNSGLRTVYISAATAAILLVIVPSPSTPFFGATVQTIMSYTFYGTGALDQGTVTTYIGAATYIIIQGYTSIGDNAFLSKTQITSVTIGTTVTTIGYNAFGTCSNLSSVTIPNSVQTIVDYAFNTCIALTSIIIPASVTSIGEGAFNSCTGLTTVTFTATSTLTSIPTKMFLNCRNLTSITIPNSVTSIGDFAFQLCIILPSIRIPALVTFIGASTFQSCALLTTVTIGKNPQTISGTPYSAPSTVSFFGAIGVAIQYP